MSDNPLLNYHTQTGIYIRLPSNGRFYNIKPEMTVDNEIEVFPMNALDELQLQNPDGLLNNESLVKVISHVCPSIKNPREIPKPDLDVILLAMRIATYGREMDVEVTCEKCDHTDQYSVNLPKILSTMKKIQDDNTLKLGDLTLYLKPYSLSSQSKLNDYMVKIQRSARILQMQTSDDEPDIELFEKIQKEMGETLRESAIELFTITSDSIEKIVMPDGNEVTEKKYINEWLDKIKAPEYRKIRDKINELSKEVIDRKVMFVCQKCNHKNEVEINFDPANFFELN